MGDEAGEAEGEDVGEGEEEEGVGTGTGREGTWEKVTVWSSCSSKREAR